MKILFLPLFKMPSGHHRVADAMINMMTSRTPKIECKKVDILSYSSKVLETAVSGFYLKWIHHTPLSYDWAYKHFAYTKDHKPCSFMGSEHFFLYYLEKLLREEQPDLVVCTHGFPSLLMSRLKEKGRVHIPVINAYTDFFMNDIWGRKGIDYHFVPNKEVKSLMIEQHQIDEQSIIVTGIPIHETFLQPKKPLESGQRKKRILIAGGSSGLGDIVGLIKNTKIDSSFEYVILCGKNQKLHGEIDRLGLPNVTALSYISSRQEMNRLYDDVDAIVTKPGGVTVGEALRKRLPIFVHSALPGQEFINFQYLKDKHLVYDIDSKENLEQQISNVLNSEIEKRKWDKALNSYLDQQDITSSGSLFNFISANVLKGTYINKMKRPLPAPFGFINRLKKYAKRTALDQ